MDDFKQVVYLGRDSPLQKMGNKKFVLFVASVILALVVIGVVFSTVITALSSKQTTTLTSSITSTSFARNSTTSRSSVTVVSSFNFSDSAAASFLQKLNTPTGMLETYVGSNTIYLADDQALDYGALMRLGDDSLANNINSSTSAYGGLYGYWNDVFVLLNRYPSSWNFNMPNNYYIENLDGYILNVTKFNVTNGSDYQSYVDLELYYSLFLLHSNISTGAITAFKIANNYWNGQGFADKPYNQSTNGYTSYKLAVDLIVFKALMANPSTERQIASYNSTITQVQGMMSRLQASDGGVITNYEIVNGQIRIAPGTYENGETTSLFVLAE